MDALDRLILNELSYRCRISFSKLAEKFDVSLTTIKNRVEALVEEGVILRFVVQLPLEIVHANFAVVVLDIKPNTMTEDLRSLGTNRFIMALGAGYEPQGFAIAVYRTNDELIHAVDHLQSSKYVENAQAFPVVGPPMPIDRSLSKGFESLKKIDWKILKSLQSDGRKTLSDIALDVGASVPTVRKRLTFMREHNLIHETIQINPAATERRFVVMFVIRSSFFVEMDHFELEKKFREKFGENYWISFRMANSPELVLTFVVDSSKEVVPLRSGLLSLFDDAEITGQMIVPEWVYFPDFRDDIIDEHLS
ncbi:MAG: Lrp/AsnC family transcriptional regulator [Candidatus Thorarchaeota archaeon]|nr:MAG: Lrp/AsnC family transcriptional regulator [Candidatus Thorarchaeota archaeon]